MGAAGRTRRPRTGHPPQFGRPDTTDRWGGGGPRQPMVRPCPRHPPAPALGPPSAASSAPSTCWSLRSRCSACSPPRQARWA